MLLMLPKCLFLSSQIFCVVVSRRFRIAITTTNRTAIPMVSNVPVKNAANGKNDNPIPPSANKLPKYHYKL